MKNFLFALLLAYSLLDARVLPAQTETPVESGPTEEMIAEEAQQQNWTKAFQEAEQVFNSVNQTESIPLFQDLIAKITEEKIKRDLTDPERLMLAKSLDYLGQAFYNEGQLDQAGSVFLKLIEMEPNYQLNSELVSSKIIEYVDKLRLQNLGALKVTSEPEGAEILIDGKPAGKTNTDALYSLKGEHDVEVKRPGFESQRQTVTVVPGKTEALAFKLVRNSSVAYFITYPKGVEVFLNGKRIGITGGEAGERAQPTATEQNLPIADFSGEFAVADLQPGSYELQFRKACWETPGRRISLETNDDHLFSPIVMAPSKGTINITSSDAQAGIFVDEEYKGVGPQQTIEACSGKHVVKVKGVMGKFRQEVDLKKDQTVTVQASLNPAVAFLGVLGQSGATGNPAASQTLEKLSGLKTLNLEDHSGSGEASAHTEAMRELLTSMEGNRPDETRKRRIQDLCNKLETDLLLMGNTLDDGRVRMYLFSNWSSMPDIREIRMADNSDWTAFRSELEHQELAFDKRIGADFVDTLITQGPAITRLSLKTYDDAKPLNVGDVITAVNGTKVRTSAELMRTLEAAKSADTVTVTVSRNGIESPVSLKMIKAPKEIDFTNADLLFNRQMANYKRFFHTASTPLEKAIALLNTGLCYMHFGEYKDALEQFRQIQIDRQTGIGTGTVRYRMAQCYRELGDIREAAASLAEAQRYPQNTVQSDDGSPLAREVERLQKTLR